MTTKQTPLHSGYGAKTTALEAIGNRDLRGLTAIVTGGHAGLGLETTRVLSGAGATVIVGTRSLDKARSGLAGIARVEIEALDLIDPASVDAFAEGFLASGRPLHILVNNDARGEAHGVRAFSLHPGAIYIELTRSVDAEELRALLASPRIAGTTFKTPEQGAATSVWCGASAQLDGMGGVYCEDVDIAEAVSADAQGSSGVRPWAMDPDLAERLWRKSEQWSGTALRPV